MSPSSIQSRYTSLPLDLKNKSPNIHENKEMLTLLLGTFPGTIKVGEGRFRSHLVFTVRELPLTPWPLTVGELPFIVAIETERLRPLFPIALLKRRNIRISICQHLDGRNATTPDIDLRSVTADLRKEILARCPNVRLVEAIFT